MTREREWTEEDSRRGDARAFPPWLRKRLPVRADDRVDVCLDDLGLGTVCRSARCPNRFECFGKGRATFLLLGPSCTRHCRFCAVERGRPHPPDPTEPERVARAVERLRLHHAVITSVTRDDLPDGGAAHFAATVRAVRERNPETTVEILVPDFLGDQEAWAVAADAGAEVFNHNVETVPRLYGRVRPEADYDRSLALLDFAAERREEGLVKSGMMLGLGETPEEVLETAEDLRGVGVDMLTVGQYLCPDREANLPVERFVPPEEFDALREEIGRMGFRFVACAPFVRSSYNAREALAAAAGRA